MRFQAATDSFSLNQAMMRIMHGDKIDKAMARSIFKYICPDSEKMDLASFQIFVNEFGLNTHGISAEQLFDVISNKKAGQYITDKDFFAFIEDIQLPMIPIGAAKHKPKVKDRSKKDVREEEKHAKHEEEKIPTISVGPLKEKKEKKEKKRDKEKSHRTKKPKEKVVA